ncbi:sensor domain-containing protein [Ectobacillus ponti]|uniref:EAL domain-containing protein n=1 Tax=Ectobacillus ponti TaxID=2961894 RepID=A0AA42BRS8_9BACI|nr:EAL domain-containing protein [Ectobacillus ponti]MCP8971292.1 EAL domain-containing protein [Ectobacillus ponti]
MRMEPYHYLFWHYTDGVVMYDQQQRLLQANDTALELIGCTLHELKQANWGDLFPVSHMQEAGDNIQRAAAGVTCEYESCFISRLGQHRPMWIRHIPMKRRGRVVSILTILRDLTSHNEALQKVNAFFLNSADAMKILDLEGRIIQVNPAFEQLYGWEQEELYGQFHLHMPETAASMVTRVLQQVAAGETIRTGKVLTQKKDGTLIPVNMTLSPIRDAGGHVVMMSVVSQDLSHQHEIERELNQAKKQYSILAQSTSDVFFVLDHNRKVVFMSPAFEKYFGIATLEQADEKLRLCIHPEDLPRLHHTRDQMYRTRKTVYVECRWLTEQERWVWLEVKGTPVLREDGTMQHIIWSTRNIQERKDHERQLNRLAYFDKVTGAPNREAVELYLQGLVRLREPFVFVHWDVDHFKWTNEQFSHETGDLVLCELVRRMQQGIRTTDYLARTGGDEFLLVLPNTAAAEAEALLQPLLEGLSQPISIGEHSVTVTISGGLVSCPEHGTDMETLWKCSERALAYAKERGRNQISQYGAAHEREAMLETHLPYAAKRGELFLVYQPKVDLTSDTVMGVEALIRWKHPLLGVIPPNEFIPLAEKRGLICEITQWVIETAAKQGKLWQDFGLSGFKISVNLSPYSLKHAQIVEQVPALLQQAHFPPQDFILEVTETGLIENVEKGRAVLNGLRAKGIQIAMDDFGVGFSSLSYLRNLPISILKVDRSFTARIDQDEKDAMIVQTIVQLAKSMQFHIVVEGVETAEQVQVLRQMGSLIAQGYFFSKPLASGEITDWLLERKKPA